ncbi:chorismate synthase [Acholeplasma sp. OttesenSCG-928-E16]|nr:chorismate synthase [Acholeplasma sp. OttesenSCG-928-E16]
MNRYGKLFNISIYGESHQESMGIIIDGIIPGTFIDKKKIKEDLALRRPKEDFETKRIEEDEFVIKSGIKNDYATGAPLFVEIKNNKFSSESYDKYQNIPRPGTPDLVAKQKYYGFNDYRGSGHFSGRITALIVIAGSIAKMMLPFTFSNKIKQVGLEKNESNFDNILKETKNKKDSIGGIIELKVSNMISGLGSPFFEKLNSKIAEILFSIPAVKGVDFGIGFAGVSLFGSEYNDPIINLENKTKTNNSGGINGGISNGNDILINCFIKPISSIGIKQKTYNILKNKMDDLIIDGNHDSSIIKRVGIVLESALAICLMDQYLIYKAYAKK